jgi:cytochrome c
MSRFVFAALVTFASLSPALAESGDVSLGRQDFRACAPCHSLEPDQNMTGPSLASLWPHVGSRRARGVASGKPCIPDYAISEQPIHGLHKVSRDHILR